MEEKGEQQKTSLAGLTQSLIVQLKSNAEPEIELSQACKLIDAPKRRLYDVVNVLQGAGLIERSGKSKIKWTDRNPQTDIVKNSLENKERELRQISKVLDEYLENMFHSEAFEKYAWVTTEDVQSLKSNPNAKLYALKGSNSLSISLDTLENGTNQLNCHSDDAPISWISIPNSAQHK